MENLEILKNVLSPETYAKVAEETKDSTIKLFDLSAGDYVSKSKYDALEASLNNTQTLLNQKTSEYDQLKASAGDNQELKDQIAQMQQSFEAEKTEIETKYQAQLKQGAINAHIIQTYRPKDINDIIPHLDYDKITVDGDKFEGIDEQMKPLQEGKAYYFDDDKPTNRTGLQHSNETELDVTAIRAAAGLE